MSEDKRSSSTTTIAVLVGGGVLFAITQTMVVPMMPALAASTGASYGELSWLVTGPLVVAAALTPSLGRLADQRGKRIVLLIVLGAMALGSFALASTTDITIMIAARCLQGVGGAFVPVATSLLRDTVPAGKFAGGVALLSGSLGFGVCLGVPLATAVAGVSDWHFVFLASGVMTAIECGLVWALVREGLRSNRARSFDAFGSVLLTLILAVTMILITEGSRWGWGNPLTLTLALGVIAAGMFWVWFELRQPDPVVDLRLAWRMPVAITNAVAFFVGFGLFANILISTQLIQLPSTVPWGFGLDLFAAGLFVVPSGLAMVLFSPISGAITNRMGARSTMLIATPVLVLGYVGHLVLPGLWGVGISMIVVSAGISIAYSALPVLISQEVPQGATASANGINVLLRTVGQTFCSSVTAALFLSFVVQQAGTEHPSAAAFDLAYGAALLSTALAFAFTLALPHRPGLTAPLPAT